MRHPTKRRKNLLWRRAAKSDCAAWTNRWAAQVPASYFTREKKLGRTMSALHRCGAAMTASSDLAAFAKASERLLPEAERRGAYPVVRPVAPSPSAGKYDLVEACQAREDALYSELIAVSSWLPIDTARFDELDAKRKEATRCLNAARIEAGLRPFDNPLPPLTQRDIDSLAVDIELTSDIATQPAPVAHHGVPSWAPPFGTLAGVLSFGFLIAAVGADLYEMWLARWICVGIAVALAICAYRWRR